METRVVTTHVPTELAEKLDFWAARLDRSKGWIVKQALANWVRDEEDRQQGVLQGLADVAAGRVVDHEAVMQWLESLGTATPLPRPKPSSVS